MNEKIRIVRVFSHSDSFCADQLGKAGADRWSKF
jgi:hypothetical protein